MKKFCEFVRFQMFILLLSLTYRFRFELSQFLLLLSNLADLELFLFQHFGIPRGERKWLRLGRVLLVALKKQTILSLQI
jgi:hypothetical protein